MEKVKGTGYFFTRLKLAISFAGRLRGLNVLSSPKARGTLY